MFVRHRAHPDFLGQKKKGDMPYHAPKMQPNKRPGMTDLITRSGLDGEAALRSSGDIRKKQYNARRMVDLKKWGYEVDAYADGIRYFHPLITH